MLLEPCPLCGTKMLVHEHCISHPKPAKGDCLLRGYSFGVPSLYATMDEVAANWNRRV